MVDGSCQDVEQERSAAEMSLAEQRFAEITKRIEAAELLGKGEKFRTSRLCLDSGR